MFEKSQKAYSEAKVVIPGGVDSPVRAFTSVGGTPPFIQKGEGAYIYDVNGRRIIDAISSWWVITHGHCHPYIGAAIRAQSEKLDQVIFAGHTHEPAEQVARGLVEMTPARCNSSMGLPGW